MRPAVAGAGRVLDPAAAFAGTLAPAQLAELRHDRTFAAAANWSNLPEGYLGDGGRLGLRTGTLDREQWAALLSLLAAATGCGPGVGFDALRGGLEADDWLRDHGGGEFYGRENFHVAFLGTPSEQGTWQLQFGGHHLALANTYRDGELVGATPSFRGIEPFAGERKHEALVALLASLGEDRLDRARLPRAYRDVLLGPGRDGAFPAGREGVRVGDLGPACAALALTAIESFVADVEDAAAARILAVYESELDSTYVSFAGSPGLTRPGDYVRLDGDSVWIEYSMHPGGVLPDPHPHSLWRDKRTDYGGLRGSG